MDTAGFIEDFLELHDGYLSEYYSLDTGKILTDLGKTYIKYAGRGWEMNRRFMNALHECLSADVFPSTYLWMWLYPELLTDRKGPGYSPIENYLKKRLASEGWYMDFNRRDLLPNSGLELDIYIPSHSAAIEVNGERYHAKKHRSDARKYHINKWNLAVESGIEVAFVWGNHFQWSRGRLTGLKPGYWSLINQWLLGEIILPTEFSRVE